MNSINSKNNSFIDIGSMRTMITSFQQYVRDRDFKLIDLECINLDIIQINHVHFKDIDLKHIELTAK